MVKMQKVTPNKMELFNLLAVTKEKPQVDISFINSRTENAEYKSSHVVMKSETDPVRHLLKAKFSIKYFFFVF